MFNFSMKVNFALISSVIVIGLTLLYSKTTATQSIPIVINTWNFENATKQGENIVNKTADEKTSSWLLQTF